MPERFFLKNGVKKRDLIRLSHSMRSLNFTSELSEVTCPVTILCGEKDRGNIKAAKRLHAFLPQSELHIIPGAGHEINKCAPEVIAQMEWKLFQCAAPEKGICK